MQKGFGWGDCSDKRLAKNHFAMLEGVFILFIPDDFLHVWGNEVTFLWVGGPNPNTSKSKSNGTTNLSAQICYIMRLVSNNIWFSMSLGLQLGSVSIKQESVSHLF